jgi:hypothetical protein
LELFSLFFGSRLSSRPCWSAGQLWPDFGRIDENLDCVAERDITALEHPGSYTAPPILGQHGQKTWTGLIHATARICLPSDLEVHRANPEDAPDRPRQTHALDQQVGPPDRPRQEVSKLFEWSFPRFTGEHGDLPARIFSTFEVAIETRSNRDPATRAFLHGRASPASSGDTDQMSGNRAH